MSEIDKIPVNPTQLIDIVDDDNLYDQLSRLSTNELLNKLKYEVEDSQTIVIIKKILKGRR